MKVLIAGQHGYIGRRTLAHIRIGYEDIQLVAYNRNHAVAAQPDRHPDSGSITHVSESRTKSRYANLIRTQKSVDCVAHLGGIRVPSKGLSKNEIWQANVIEPESCFRASIEAGIRRFVFLSSIAVNGNSTLPGRPFNGQSIANPEGLYAESKYAAECRLKRLASKHEVELIIIRAPMVYGPDAPGTFENLVRIIRSGMPLPLGNIRNKKSFISIYNLVDILSHCIFDTKAESGTYSVSDGDDISTSDFIVSVAEAYKLPARLFRCDERLLAGALQIFGKRQLSEKLIKSCQIDITDTQSKIKWSPTLTVNESLLRLQRERSEALKL